MLRIIGGTSIAINKEEIKQNGDRKTGCTTITYKWAWDTKKARAAQKRPRHDQSEGALSKSCSTITVKLEGELTSLSENSDGEVGRLLGEVNIKSCLN